eukprot:9596552-Ditylum_brightwellii.AAC.1
MKAFAPSTPFTCNDIKSTTASKMLYRKLLTPHPVPAPSALLPNTEHDCICASCSGARSHQASCT